MSSKSEAAYIHVLEYIEQNVFSMKNCSSFMTDYERAMKNALRAVYGPQVKIFSCWFHFTQAVKRKASQIDGFYSFIRANAERERLYYKLLSLPLLPSYCIHDIFRVLDVTARDWKNAAMNAFLDYYNRQWIRKV